MIEDFLRKAVEFSAERVEIEYKDGVELFTAFRGTVGIGLSSVDSSHRDVLFPEMEDLKKRKRDNGCRGLRKPSQFPSPM